jgi:hypothetical protein
MWCTCEQCCPLEASSGSTMVEHFTRNHNLQGSKLPQAWEQRYQVSKIDCLRFVMCSLLAPVFIGFSFAAAVNSTNEANKAGSMCH